MANKLINTNDLTNVANSIRTKLGVSTQYKVSQMSAAIDSIQNEPANYIKDITNVDNVYTATKKDDTTIAWTVQTLTTMVNALFPVGAVWTTTDETQDPNTLFSGTTWELIGGTGTKSYIPNLPNVFGNGKAFGWTDGTKKAGAHAYYYGGSSGKFNTCFVAAFGQDLGGSHQSSDQIENKDLGLVQKSQLTSDTYSYTGITLDTTQVYMWKRTV